MRTGVLPRATIGAQYFPNEFDCILGSKFFHNMPAMTFEGSRAYSKNSRRCLVGRARRNLFQHLDFPAGEAVAARKGSPPDFRRFVLPLPALPSVNRFAPTLHDQTGIHPFLDEVTRAIPHSLDRDRNVAMAGDDKDRSWIIR